MCYTVIISTSSSEDLTQYNTELVRFSANLSDIPEKGKLRYPHQWYIGSKSGCSCTFRHLHSPELGFSAPVDWYEEVPDEIEATLQVVKVFRRLIEGGHALDCVDTWPQKEGLPADLEELEVDLRAIKDEEFRFIENHHFSFKIQT